MLIVLGICFGAWHASAQQIERKWVGLRIDRPRGDSAVYLGLHQADVVRILGKPSTVTQETQGINNQAATVLWYRKSQLIFIADHLVEFDLLDDVLVIGETPKTSFGVKFMIANKPRQIARDARRPVPNFINSCNILAGFSWVAKPGIVRGKPYVSRYFTYLGNAGAKPTGWLEVLFNEIGEVTNVAAGLL